MRRTFGTKRSEITAKWRKIYDKDPHDFCSYQNTIRAIK
jgi:hypothetical protein